MKIKNELSEQDLAIETKRKEIVSLLSSHDRKTKTSVIETVCTELEDLQSKNDKKSESFKVTVEAVAKKLKVINFQNQIFFVILSIMKKYIFLHYLCLQK